MAVTTPDVCRVTVVTPNRWADLALPAGEPLALLLPALVDHVGDLDLEGRPLALQRLGGSPFDEDRSLAGNGVLDGETLYLNPAEDALPPLDFDDAIAGLGSGVDGLSNRWKPLYTRRMLLSVAPLPAGLGWLLLALAPSSAGVRAGLAAAAALLLVLGTAIASRAWDDRTLGQVLGVCALPFAALAGALGVVSLSAGPVVSPAAGLGAGAALFGAAVVADVALGHVGVVLTAAAFSGALLQLGCLVGQLAGWDVPSAAALVVVLAVVSVELSVTLACRLAGVFLPPLPRTADELEEGIEPVPAQDALTRAAQVDQYLTALLWGAAVVLAPAAVVLVGRGTWPMLLVLAASASALLRLRVFYGRGQRAAMLVAGLAGPAALVVGGALAAGGTAPAWVALAALVASGALFTAVVTVPARRTLPHLGRAAEILEGVVAASLLPVLLAVLGAYSAARNIR